VIHFAGGCASQRTEWLSAWKVPFDLGDHPSETSIHRTERRFPRKVYHKDHRNHEGPPESQGPPVSRGTTGIMRDHWGIFVSGLFITM